MPYFKQLCETAIKNDKEKFNFTLEEARSKLSKEEYELLFFKLNEHGRGLIHLVKDRDLFQTLLNNGAKITQLTDPEENSVLDLYLSKEQSYSEDMVCFFLDQIMAKNIQEKNMNANKIQEVLEFAVKQDHFKVVTKILGSKVDDVHARNHDNHDYLASLKQAIKKNDNELFKRSIGGAMADPKFDVNDNVNGVSFLSCAIKNRNFMMFEALLALGADVNKTTDGCSPLREILETLRQTDDNISFSAGGPLIKMIIELINHPKTNLKEIIHGRSALSRIAFMIRLSDLDGVVPEKANLIKTLKYLTIVGHRYHLKGELDVEGHTTNLERAHQGIFSEELIRTFQAFLIHPDIRQELNHHFNVIYKTSHVDYFAAGRKELDLASHLQADLSCIGQPMDIKEIQERDKNNLITPIPIFVTVNGEGAHVLAYVFFQDFCMRINCGPSADKKEISGIGIYKIGDKKSLMQVMPKLLAKVDDAFLMGDFIKIGKLALIHTVQRPDQTLANCSFRSLEEMEFALFIMHLYKVYKNPYLSDVENFKTAVPMAEKLFNLLKRFDRDYGLLQLMKVEQYLTQAHRNQIQEATKQAKVKEEDGKAWVPQYQGYYKQRTAEYQAAPRLSLDEPPRLAQQAASRLPQEEVKRKADSPAFAVTPQFVQEEVKRRADSPALVKAAQFPQDEVNLSADSPKIKDQLYTRTNHIKSRDIMKLIKTFTCPLTKEIPKDPVYLLNAKEALNPDLPLEDQRCQVFSRKALTEFFARNKDKMIHPVTGRPLQAQEQVIGSADLLVTVSLMLLKEYTVQAERQNRYPKFDNPFDQADINNALRQYLPFISAATEENAREMISKFHGYNGETIDAFCPKDIGLFMLKCNLDLMVKDYYTSRKLHRSI